MGDGTTTESKQTLTRIRYEFVLEAETPICHLSESIGNESIAMRRKIRQRDGWAFVPIVTADTMRHGMREASAYALLDALGMVDSPQLSEAALRLLFAGGAVSGSDGAGTVNLDAYRELCELVPSMALLGGCATNRIVPGRLSVEDATLICQETQGFITERARAWSEDRYGALAGSREHIEEEQRVRMDPTMSPEKRKLLTDGEQVKATNRLAAHERASIAAEHVEKDKEKSSMMPRRFERVAQGSLFFWAVQANCYTPLEVDTLHVSCAAFLANAVVGGKRGTGHGRLRAVKGWGLELARPREAVMDADPAALAPSMGALFRSHVEARKGRIVDFLKSVDA